MDEKEKLKNELARLSEAAAKRQNDAAVAGLMPSFMHEMNNLIGIGVTAASVLESKVADTAKALEQGTLKRSDMDVFLSDAAEASELVAVNLTNMAELVQAFRQVVMNHARREVCAFNLKTCLEGIVFSLRPRLRRTPHAVALDCPEDLRMVSSAGALTLVVINLVLNSLNHAFREGQKGHIRMSAALDPAEDQVTIVYADDGVGIPEKDIPFLFRPFFSSSHENGGGLGLFTVYRMVHFHLKGKITVENGRESGVLFRIVMPRRVTF